MRVVALVLLAVVAGSACSVRTEYYNHDPYGSDDRTIDKGLSRSEQRFADALTLGHARVIARSYTAPGSEKDMARFVISYEKLPTTIYSRRPSDDATADLKLAITCPTGQVRHVTVNWAWYDGAWRAGPDDYLGCPRVR